MAHFKIRIKEMDYPGSVSAKLGFGAKVTVLGELVRRNQKRKSSSILSKRRTKKIPWSYIWEPPYCDFEKSQREICEGLWRCGMTEEIHPILLKTKSWYAYWKYFLNTPRAIAHIDKKTMKKYDKLMNVFGRD